MKHFLKYIFLCLCIFSLTATGIIINSEALVEAKDSYYKFSSIDLKVKVPDSLITFTRATTNNNAYLEKIGADDANEVRTMMESSDIYLEAVDSAVSYEIAIIGMRAGSSLPSDLSQVESDELNKYFEEYIKDEEAIDNASLTEVIDEKSIEYINDQPYFITNVTSTAADHNYATTKKVYTIKQGYIYVFTLQANNSTLTDEMIDNLDYVLDSAVYVKINPSLLENGVFTETVSVILTAAGPILLLAIIVLLLTRFGKKSNSKLLKEEAELRAKYKEDHS